MHFPKGAVSVLTVSPGAAFAALRLLATRGRSGDDPKLSGPFAILRGFPAGLGDGPGFGFTAVAVVSVRWRKGGLALDATQHDQVDEAAIPALVSKVAARKGRNTGIKNFPPLEGRQERSTWQSGAWRFASLLIMWVLSTFLRTSERDPLLS